MGVKIHEIFGNSRKIPQLSRHIYSPFLNHSVMAFSKAHKFAASVYYYSLLYKAVSHPARILILLKLIQADARLPVSTIADGIPLTKATLSEHLRVLREMHILCCEADGPYVWYSFNTDMPQTRKELVYLVIQATMNALDSTSELIGLSHRHGNINVAN